MPGMFNDNTGCPQTAKRYREASAVFHEVLVDLDHHDPGRRDKHG